ncbi:MAG: DUF4783 domain-containing protein [Saprospiraceae bacterium]|nr:DUF4783 domain-containing protein [Saprospiraceae bacterium]
MNSIGMRLTYFLGLAFITLHLSAQMNLAFDALTRNDMAELSKLLDDKVEVCFDNSIQFMDRNQAIQSIQKFLNNNPVKSCTITHKGEAKGRTSQYMIGRYVNIQGKSFRIFIYFSQQSGKSVIKEFKIDQD